MMDRGTGRGASPDSPLNSRGLCSFSPPPVTTCGPGRNRPEKRWREEERNDGRERIREREAAGEAGGEGLLVIER